MTTINKNTGKRLSIESRKADLKKKKILNHVFGVTTQSLCYIGAGIAGITAATGLKQCVSAIKSKSGKGILAGLVATAIGCAGGVVNIKNASELGEIYGANLVTLNRETRALEKEEATIETDKVIRIVNGQNPI